MAVTGLSFLTCNMEIIAPLPGGFGSRNVFWAEAQGLRRCAEQRSGREGNCNSLFFGLERGDERTRHSFTFKICLVWVVTCLFLPVTLHWCCLSDNSRVDGAASAALCFGLKRCRGHAGSPRMLGVGVSWYKSLHPRTAPTRKGWEGCFVCDQQQEKIFGLSIETLGG